MRKKLKIFYVDYGIANRMGNEIEINKKLLSKEYKPLFTEILEHEVAHTSKGYSTRDFALDIKGFDNAKLYWNFILTTPSSWWQFLPLYKSRKRWFWDWSVFMLWVISIILIWSLWRMVLIFTR